MDSNSINIPDRTIETLARSFFKESSQYGFNKMDYLRFVNILLDIAMNHNVELLDSLTTPTSNGTYATPSKKLKMPIRGLNLKIRWLELKGLPLFDEWLQDDVGRLFTLSRTNAKELKLSENVSSQKNLIGIVTLLDSKPIGAVAFLNVDAEQRKAELRKLIGIPSLRGKGLGRDATRLWIQYGLNTLGLRKIYLNTLNTNLRNIKLNEDLGFKAEGVLRNEVYFDGKYHDVLRMGLCRP